MTDRISPKDLRHGDKVWIITASNQCWWQTNATIDQDGPWLTATFEPESRQRRSVTQQSLHSRTHSTAKT